MKNMDDAYKDLWDDLEQMSRARTEKNVQRNGGETDRRLSEVVSTWMAGIFVGALGVLLLSAILALVVVLWRVILGG